MQKLVQIDMSLSQSLLVSCFVHMYTWNYNYTEASVIYPFDRLGSNVQTFRDRYTFASFSFFWIGLYGKKLSCKARCSENWNLTLDSPYWNQKLTLKQTFINRRISIIIDRVVLLLPNCLSLSTLNVNTYIYVCLNIFMYM